MKYLMFQSVLSVLLIITGIILFNCQRPFGTHFFVETNLNLGTLNMHGFSFTFSSLL